MTDSMTLNPFGTAGTGYDVSTYGQSAKMDEAPDSEGTSSAGSSTGSSSSMTSNQPAAADPIPSFTWKVLASRRVDFTSTSLNAVRYAWTVRNIVGAAFNQSSQENPTFYFPSYGGTVTYAVTLRAYNSEGDYVDSTMRVEVEDLIPECDFTYTVSGLIVRFTDTSTNVNSAGNMWAFGDGSVVFEPDPHHTYPGNGQYSVRLVNGSYSRTKTITIDAEVLLECDQAAEATGYKWERSPDGVNDWVEFADTPVESVGVTEATYGVDSTVLNYFRVRAYNGAGNSGYSNITNVRCG
ncbi:hypothetical protein KAR91_54765 [Candidatus Pacearchaeota archaeon]|nr:hypothetical protein [Candidatus Pacearchaeota archaeon]